MSANELIEQIKLLSREEQEQVFAFVRSLLAENASHDEPGVRYMDPEKAKKVSAEIFSARAELFRKLAK